MNEKICRVLSTLFAFAAVTVAAGCSSAATDDGLDDPCAVSTDPRSAKEIVLAPDAVQRERSLSWVVQQDRSRASLRCAPRETSEPGAAALEVTVSKKAGGLSVDGDLGTNKKRDLIVEP